MADLCIADEPATGTAEFQDLRGVDLLDDLVFQREDVFYWTREQVEEMQLRLIPEAFRFHYEGNPGYRLYCDSLGQRPRRFSSVDELAQIPLLTSTQFKLRDVLSCAAPEVVKVCTSSGTRGSISRVHRDETTLCRFLGSVQCTLDQILQLDDAFVFHLGPSKDEAGDLWISYVMSVFDMIFPTENFVVDDVFHPQRVVERLEEVRGDYEHVVFVAPPIMYLHLLEHMEARGIRFEGCENFVMLTGGGWKRFTGQAIPRAEFEERLERNFAGFDRRMYRDLFNMVEMNTVMAECEHHVKHVPPWLRVLVLDAATLRPVPAGQEGLLAFLDPTAVSYPGFILTDDVARLGAEDGCACGRTGPGVEILRRLNKVEARGCALRVDRNYSYTVAA